VQRDKVPGGFDGNRYEVARVLVPSGGASVPVSVVQKKGVPHDGNAPLLLTGYGAYGVSYDVEFDETRLALLDRGVIIVFAHVRGGGDVDRKWHDDGRMLQKQHSFDDFIAVADWLVSHRYSSPAHMAILGGSAGGLLMGAVLNLRPELFRCAVAQVPFVDVVNTMLDESLPLTVGEFEEWGNPKIAEQYRYLRSYCPYENVRPTAYPPILVTSALHDARAPFWEAVKWVAQLRARKTDQNPIILHIDLESGGHGGPSGRYEQIKDDAYQMAFILTQLGVEPSAAH
jgi:oligopeptidase B